MNKSPGFTSSNDPLPLIDGAGRLIDHLRLSLTDACNLSCRYCTNEHGHLDTHRIETDFAVELVRWLSARHGVRHVRLTGGEPLLHPDLIPLVKRLNALPRLDEVTLTTNAQALAHKARDLRDAGLSRINISLDTLRPDRFARMTGGGNVARTLRGIEAAREVGLTPLHINVVVQRGCNDDEISDIATWGLACGCVVRFLEVMPVGPLVHVLDQHLVPASKILERLAQRFELRPISSPPGQPATDYAVRGSGLRGVIGVISSTSRPFCSQCRRLRVTSAGQLLTCLFDEQGVSLKDAWAGQSFDQTRADAILLAAVKAKPVQGQHYRVSPMSQIGG